MARTVDDCDKFVLASGDYFLQSLPLKGLMKFLPNLLSICVGVTLKRMMNATHHGSYSFKKVQRIGSLNARPKKNCSRFPTGIAAACQRCWKNVQYHQHYSYS